MEGFVSRLLKNKFQPREYQLNIAKTALEKNTLVVLPTGTGKTFISLLLAVKRLEKFPESKILILSPTRPLSAQHKKTFEEFTTINPEQIVLITGKIKPKDRKKLYDKAKIVVATPQTIANDLNNNILNLENFSFLTVDESHRSVKRYSYPFVVKKYVEQSKFPLILGLTASPGGAPEKIKEICENLFIEAVEIRTERDSDVLPYVQPIEKEWIYVELPQEFQHIKTLIEECLKENIFWLRDYHYLDTLSPSIKLLLMLQEKLITKYKEEPKNHLAFLAMMKVIEAIKLEHAIELLETQGISQLFEYLKKFEESKKRIDKKIVKDPRIKEVFKILKELMERNVEHPKLEKLVYIIKDIINKKQDAKIIVFANYRNTVEKINKTLIDEGIKSEILVGQSMKNGRGLTQQKQIEILRRFEEASFNVLCGTSISEEGLSIADVPYVIFYEPVASEIRMIQRRGRTGRTSPGKIIFLITKGTRDEAYYWASFHKEKKMKGILYDMKWKRIKTRKAKMRTLLDWVK